MDVIFDIDGVLADASTRVDQFIRPPRLAGLPIDWDAFFGGMGSDAPVQPMIVLARGLFAYGCRLFLVTGRPEEYRDVTIEWLTEYGVSYTQLIMRPAGNQIDDDRWKVSIVEDLREAGHNPVIAVDDRARINRAYRKAGLITLACNEEDF